MTIRISGKWGEQSIGIWIGKKKSYNNRWKREKRILYKTFENLTGFWVLFISWWPQNEELEPLFLGSKRVRFKRGGFARFSAYSIYENDDLHHFSFKNPPRSHPTYSNVAKTGRCLTNPFLQNSDKGRVKKNHICYFL